MRSSVWFVIGLLVTVLGAQSAFGEESTAKESAERSSLMYSVLQPSPIRLTSDVPVSGNCPAHTDTSYKATLCPQEYYIELPANTTSLLILLQKEGVRNLVLAMTFGKSIRDSDSFWVSRSLDSSPTSDFEGMLWNEDELRKKGTLPGTWYISVLNLENSPQNYVLIATLETRQANQPPNADFTFSPSNPTTDDTVQFTDRSSDPEGAIARREWNFGDGSTSSQQNPTHRYTQDGTYTVSLKVTDSGGLSDTESKSITVVPTRPVAPSNLQATAKSSTEIQLQWRDNSNNEDGFKIERKIQGGSYSEIRRVGANTTSYSDTGLTPNTTYYYRVRAYKGSTDSNYSNEVSTTTQPPPNRQPTANAGQDQTVRVKDTVQLNGSASSDPDGDQLSFRWRFTQRPTGSQASLSSSTTAQTTFVPDVAGQYIVELIVDDGRGGTDSDTVTITAQEIPTYPYTGNFTRGQLGQLAVPQDIRSNLPQMARFVERPNTTHQGQRSDSLAPVGLSLNPTTGTIFGTPTQAGQFRYLIEVQDQNNKTVAFLLASVTISEPQPQPSLVVTPTELSLSARVGDPNPTVKLTIRNAGGGTLNWTARTDASWLTLNPAQGALSAGQSLDMTITATLTDLAAGTHQGTITVEAPNVGMVNIGVTLQLEPQGQPTGPLSVNPASLSFSGQVGGQNPGRQELVLTNTGNESVAWAAAVEGDWLYLSVSSGTLPPGERITIQVWPEISRLSVGTYQGKITFSAPRSPEIQPVIVPVTLILTGPTPPPGEGELLALKFIVLEFLKPADWERALRDGCVVYKNINAEPSSIRVTLIDNSTQEFAIPSGNEVIVCGDVAHIDTRQ